MGVQSSQTKSIARFEQKSHFETNRSGLTKLSLVQMNRIGSDKSIGSNEIKQIRAEEGRVEANILGLTKSSFVEPNRFF